MNELDSALVGVADFAERISGEVSVACVPPAVSYFLPGVISRFHELYPRIRVRLVDESASELLLAVANAKADLGLTYIGTQEPDIKFEPLMEDPFVVACTSEHALAKRKGIGWADIASYDHIALAQGSGNRFLIDQALARVENKPKWFCEVRHVPALVSLVEAGWASAWCRGWRYRRGKLVSIKLETPALSRTIGIIRRRGRPLRLPAELFQRLLPMELASRKRPDTETLRGKRARPLRG
ncbi:LysR substrate-binding domain-containing protein [Azohydromonas lata]|uniref:LysR substrate-binding domain-containing protein n=1 Tax=Azohydromonas lata TaxID=45677 RepID=A0ABU5IDV0_9BURK|nr:LysR substrate-binding domain-containing protein [Azohydromonas lata]MDZ5456840.1 LysR substrate-binding domain-containing protein [Azohydromonas lata]